MILAEADYITPLYHNGDDGQALVYGVDSYTVTDGDGDCCINPDWIDPTAVCSFLYDPVTGCDGVVYSNDCQAQGAGVSSWVDADGNETILDWDCQNSESIPNFVVLDWIGNFNGDPGAGWDVAGIVDATKDHTLVRKCGINSGNTDWASSAGTDTSNSEWVVLDQDDWTYLGFHEVECPDPVFGCTDSSACNYNLELSLIHI